MCSPEITNISIQLSILDRQRKIDQSSERLARQADVLRPTQKDENILIPTAEDMYHVGTVVRSNRC